MLNDIIFNIDQAKLLKETIVPLSKNNKFIMVCGGGYLARKYQSILKRENYSEYDINYIGTLACNMNAVMLRAVFGELAEENILALEQIEDDVKLEFQKPFQFAGGGPVGPSSDWDAVHLAIRSGSKVVISMKDVSGVYSEDPDTNPNAILKPTLTWDEYLEIIGNPEKHKPGGNFPIDPEAARYAKENKIEFRILNGKDLNNFKLCIEEQIFIGSRVF